MDGGTQARLPQRLSRPHVEGAEGAIEVADEADTARGRHHRRQERRTLFAAPHFLHRLHVIGGELADVAVAPGHLEEPAIRTRAARAVGEFELPARHLHARLAERNDQQTGTGVIAHRLPVVAALSARTRRHPLTRLLLQDVGAVRRRAGLRIDRVEHVLEHGLLVAKELSVATIELPENSRFANREQQLLIADVDENALEHLVEIQRFAGRVLIMPCERAVLRPQRERRARVERIVEVRGAAACAHPWLRLRRAPIGQIEIGIVAAGDPRLAADAQVIRQFAPRLRSRLAGSRDRVEFPQLLAGCRIVPADPAAVVPVPIASDKAVDDDAFDHDGAGGVCVALRAVGNGRRPHLFAGACVERDEPRVGCRDEHPVLVDRHVAHRGDPSRLVRAHMVFPNELAGSRVERLDEIQRVGEIHDAVVNDGRRLVGLAFVHRPGPCELQLLDVVARDLRERTVTPALIITARHQPVAGIRAAQHLVGDRHVVLHLAGESDPQRAGGCRAAASGRRANAPAALAAASCRGLIGRPAALCAPVLRGRLSTRRDAADRHGGGRGERLRSRLGAVGLQDVRGDSEILVGAETFSRGRHRALDELEQVAGRSRAPCVHEIRAGELRRFIATGKVGQVAAGAIRLVHREALGGLARSEHRGWRLLGRHHGNAARNGCRNRDVISCHRLASAGISQPRRFPSGAFSLCTWMYKRPFSRSATCAGVRSTVPPIVPLVPDVTVRSNTTGPRRPRAGLLCICAIVADDRNPSNVPVTVSFAPLSTADTDPLPLIVACMATSIGTGESRALNVFAACARTGGSESAKVASRRTAPCERVMMSSPARATPLPCSAS